MNASVVPNSSKRTYPKSKKTADKSKRKNSTNQTKGLRKFVKKIVNDMAETKTVCHTKSYYPRELLEGLDAMTENYFCVLPADMLNAPALVPGTTEDSRVGLEVTTKRAYFKYAITPTRYQTAPGVDFNPYPCPFILRMILYHRKKSPNDAPQVSQMTDSATCDFFEEGGDVEGWSGGIVDLTKKVNDNTYVYHKHWDFKVGQQIINPAAGGVLSASYFANNDFNYEHHGVIDITKYCPKKMIWDTNGELQTWVPTVVFSVVPVGTPNSGAAEDASWYKLCKLDIKTFYEYVDM